MQTIEIEGVKRDSFGKKAAKDIRRAKRIPCVLYGGQNEFINFSIDERALKPIYTSPKSFLVSLSIDGVKYLSVAREIQYHPVKDYALHADFFRIDEAKNIAIDVPVRLSGSAAGVKAGGKLVLYKRKLRVSAMEANLPDELVVDVTNLALGKCIFVSELHYDNLSILSPATAQVCGVLTTRQATMPEEGGEAGAEAAAPAAE